MRLPRFLSTSIALLVTLLAACSSQTVLNVGKYSFSKQDIEDRNQVIRVFYSGETRDLGPKQLTDAYTAASILENNGHAITHERIEQEAARIDRETRDPATLQKIKAVFGKRTDAYQRVFVVPTYAERIIYFDFFMNHAALHEVERAKATQFLNTHLKQPESFVASARKLGVSLVRIDLQKNQPLSYRPFEIMKTSHPAHLPADAGMKMEAPAAKTPHESELHGQINESAKRESAQWWTEIGEPLRPAQVFSRVVDNRDAFMVLFLDQKTAQKAQLIGAVFPKRSYTDWYADEAKKISVK